LDLSLIYPHTIYVRKQLYILPQDVSTSLKHVSGTKESLFLINKAAKIYSRKSLSTV